MVEGIITLACSQCFLTLAQVLTMSMACITALTIWLKEFFKK